MIDENNRLWSAYLDAEMLHGHGRVRKLSKAYFAMKHGIPLSEFYRLFSYRDARGIPPGSAPFKRMRGAMISATTELEKSHGNVRASQIFSAKAAVSSVHA